VAKEKCSAYGKNTVTSVRLQMCRHINKPESVLSGLTSCIPVELQRRFAGTYYRHLRVEGGSRQFFFFFFFFFSSSSSSFGYKVLLSLTFASFWVSEQIIYSGERLLVFTKTPLT
jgi:hypothetical protein